MSGKTKNIVIVVLLCLLVIPPVAYYTYRKHKTEAAAKQKAAEQQTFSYTISVNDTGNKGYLLMGIGCEDHKHGRIAIMDMGRNKLFQKEVNGYVFDFRQWKVDGKIYYSYGIDDPNAYHMKGPFIPEGHIVILDSALHEIKQLHLIPYDDITIDNHQDLDLHDVVMLSEDRFITLAGYPKTVNNIPDSLHPGKSGTKVIACIIQESANGKVIWQWDATHFPELYGASKDDYSGDTTHDYTHVNAIIIDPKDSNLIVSFRDLNQIIKLNRKTGDIMWRLGGKKSDFAILPYQRFLWQHGVIFTDSGKTLMFVDNGHKEKRPYSRILELQLNEKDKQISSFNTYKIPHLFILQQGNVNKTGRGKYLICGGGTAKYILLTDPRTDEYLFELKTNAGIYRTYLADSIYGLEKTIFAANRQTGERQ